MDKITRTLYFGSMLALVIATVRGKTSLSDYYRLRESADVLQEALSQMEFEIETLDNEIEKIKNSPSYAKKILRDKYHLTEDDEFIIFFGD